LAMGIIMCRDSCSDQEAEAVLRTRAQAANRRLYDVAREIVECCSVPASSGPRVL
jgi:AmiR/NasT family two-component response regulator